MKIPILLIAIFFVSGSFCQTTVSTIEEGTPDDGIAIDSNGNIYASNFTGDTVFKYTPSGDVSSFITGLDQPNGIAFDSNDNLYVCDFGASTIYRYDIGGNQTGAIFIPGNPSGIIKAFDSDDMIYTRYTSNSIHNLTPAGVITEISSDPQLNGPVGLTYDENGVLYVANYNDREIYRMGPNGQLIFVALVGQSSNIGFITYAHGLIWATVLGEHKIYVVDPNEIDNATVIAGSIQGGMDGPLSQATFDRPNGILYDDQEDTIYVTDYGTKNLRIIQNIVLSTNDADLQNSSFNIFPNPAKNVLNISFKSNLGDTYEIVVYDALNRLIYKSDSLSNSNFSVHKIDSSNWSSGIHFIKVTSGAYSEIKKVVIE